MKTVMPTHEQGHVALTVDKQLLDYICVFDIHTIYYADDQRSVVGWAIDKSDWDEVERLLYRMYRSGKALAKHYRTQRPVLIYTDELRKNTPESWVIK
jgi:hypothetical protein